MSDEAPAQDQVDLTELRCVAFGVFCRAFDLRHEVYVLDTCSDAEVRKMLDMAEACKPTEPVFPASSHPRSSTIVSVSQRLADDVRVSRFEGDWRGGAGLFWPEEEGVYAPGRPALAAAGRIVPVNRLAYDVMNARDAHEGDQHAAPPGQD